MTTVQTALWVVVMLVALALIFDFMNGFHDAANSIATIVSTGVDKFANTELEKLLKAAGTQTVIATGTAAHGAVLYTASAASLRGLKVLLPVDGMSADTAYTEQFVAVHMTTAPLVSRNVTLTKLELMKF